MIIKKLINFLISIKSNTLDRLMSLFGFEMLIITSIDKIELLNKEYHNCETKNQDFCFIQIGANDGVKFDNLYNFVTTHKCKGVVVEPLKKYFKELERNYSNYPNIIPLNYAVHKSKRKANLYYVDPAKLHLMQEHVEGMGSFFINHLLKEVHSEHIITEEVECIHMMEIIKKSNFKEITFLQTDVEGYDGEIIKMIDFNSIKPKVIVYESIVLGLKEKKEIRKLLKSYGYKLYNFLDRGHNTIATLSPSPFYHLKHYLIPFRILFKKLNHE